MESLAIGAVDAVGGSAECVEGTVRIGSHVAPEGTTALESSNLVAQLRATRAAAGLCVLPAFLGEQEPDLVRVLPDRIKLSRSLWLNVHQDLSALARVKAVVAFIKDAVRAERSIFQLD